MRVLYLRTTTFQCDPHVGSILQLEKDRKDIEVVVRDYFVEKVDLEITEWAAFYKPDVIVWLGVCGGPHQPSPNTFLLMRQSGIKTIMLCPEASHPDWHALIQTFITEKSFDLIVNLDGTPSDTAFTTLAIYDQRPYANPKPWSERSVDVGFCGGCGGPDTMRKRLLEHLKGSKNFKFVEAPFVDVPGTYQTYADFMMDCKIIVNSAGSSGDKSKHVKGRVIEAGLAGCTLLEEEGSPITKWFNGSCYLSFSDPQNCEDIAGYLLGIGSGDAQRTAANLSRHVRALYSPEVLWEQIFAKIS